MTRLGLINLAIHRASIDAGTFSSGCLRSCVALTDRRAKPTRISLVMQLADAPSGRNVGPSHLSGVLRRPGVAIRGWSNRTLGDG